MKSIGIEPLPRGIKRPEPTADYGSMTKEELINELMLKAIEVARAKKVLGERGRKGDRNTYFDGLEMVAEKIKKIEGLNPILHTDQGTAYASKGFNELLPPISSHAFDVPRWNADGQRGDGGRERAGQNRDVHRFRRGPLRRRAVVR